MRYVRPSYCSSRSSRLDTLPTLLDIFSPSASTTNPLCIQWLAKRSPRATAWARSFSWCGKRRSMPPQCRSKPSPSRARLITTHSLCQLPQHEVGRVTLALSAEHLPLTATGDEVVERLVGQQAVVGHRLDGEVHAVVGDVGMTRLGQAPDHRHHLVDPLGGVGDLVGTGHVDPVHRLEPDPLAPLGDLLPGPLLGVGPVDDLVVDVGDVRDQAHVETRPAEVADEDIVFEGRPAMP